ncbi:SLC13 family permease [Methanocaldococcus indicus]|uniref:SLC13 family permease n=1 Tax=Methanocaldococcus indicus TaxID=213231 RepID=UPI003C6DA0F5
MRADTLIFSIFIFIGILMLFFVVNISQIVYIVEWKTILSLFYLMVVVEILKSSKFLDYISLIILRKTKRVFIAIIFLTLILSMFLTNDVVLFVIVPLTLIMFESIEDKKDLEKLIIFEGISANIGSGFTPIGNPQNLFLYHFYHIGVLEFLKNMLPYEILGVFILLFFLEYKKYRYNINVNISFKKEWILYIFIFLLVIFSIFGVINYLYILPIILALIIIKRPKIDYLFLVTFIFLFIDIYGLKKLGIIELFDIKGNDITIMIYSSLLSQIISNVPATVLLSNIYNNWIPIAYGVNIGGNGTLIASFANLITLRLSNRNVSIGAFLFFSIIVYILHLLSLIIYLSLFS